VALINLAVGLMQRRSAGAGAGGLTNAVTGGLAG
jgi:hypothetical protein